MMPGETHSAAPGTAADLSRCQGCASLQQNLNEYVEALIALKQKIINTDNLLTEYQKKCDELQFARRENSTLHHQVEQMLQKISPLQKCQEELGSLKAELEEKKSSLKLYQDTHQEYVRVKEECLKTDAQKKKLEAKVKKLEEAAIKQIQDFKQLRNEKKILEKEFKKTQERLDEFSKQKNEKKLRHIGTQISSDSYGSIDRRKVKLLLKELWLCINTSHSAPGGGGRCGPGEGGASRSAPGGGGGCGPGERGPSGSTPGGGPGEGGASRSTPGGGGRCVPERPAQEKSQPREPREAGVLAPAGGSAPGASAVRTCLAELSMEVEGDFSTCEQVARAGPPGAARRGEGQTLGPSTRGGEDDGADFADHGRLFDEDLQAAVDFFKLPPPLLSPVPSPPLGSLPHLGTLPSSLAPETYFGEYTDSSDNDSAQHRTSAASVSEDDTPEVQGCAGLSGRSPQSGMRREQSGSHGAVQVLNALEGNKATAVGFGTLTATLREPSATYSLAREKLWTVSSPVLSDRKRGVCDEAQGQSEAGERGELVQTEGAPRTALGRASTPEWPGSLARQEAALGMSDVRYSPLGRRPFPELGPEGRAPLPKMAGSPSSDFVKWTPANEITCEPGRVSVSEHLRGLSGELEKEGEDVHGFSAGECPGPEEDAGDVMGAAGLDADTSFSSSSTSGALSVCSNAPSSSALTCAAETGVPAEVSPAEGRHAEQTLQARPSSASGLPSEPPECPMGEEEPGSGARAVCPELGVPDFRDQGSSEVECPEVEEGVTRVCALPQSVFVKATKGGQCERQGLEVELPPSQSGFTALVESQSGLIKHAFGRVQSTSWHQSDLSGRGGEERLSAQSEHEQETHHRLQKAVPPLENRGSVSRPGLAAKSTSPVALRAAAALLPNQVSVITKQARPERPPSARPEPPGLPWSEPTPATESVDHGTGSVASTARCADGEDTAEKTQEAAPMERTSPAVPTSQRKSESDSPGCSLSVENPHCSTSSKLSFLSENIPVQNEDPAEPAVREEGRTQSPHVSATHLDSAGTSVGELPDMAVAQPEGCPVAEMPCGDRGVPGGAAQARVEDAPHEQPGPGEPLQQPSQTPAPATPAPATPASSPATGREDEEPHALPQGGLPGPLCCYTGIREVGGGETELESEAPSCSEGESEPEAVPGSPRPGTAEAPGAVGASAAEPRPSTEVGCLTSALREFTISALSEMDRLSTSEVVQFLESCQLRDYSSGDSVSESSSKETVNREMSKELKQSETSGEKCSRPPCEQEALETCQEWVESEEEDGPLTSASQLTACSLETLSEVLSKIGQELQSSCEDSDGNDVANLLLFSVHDSMASEPGKEPAPTPEASSSLPAHPPPPTPGLDAKGASPASGASSNEDTQGRPEGASDAARPMDSGVEALSEPAEPAVQGCDSGEGQTAKHSAACEAEGTFQCQISTVTSEVINVLINKDQNLVIEKGDNWTIINGVALMPDVDQVILCDAPADAPGSPDGGGLGDGFLSLTSGDKSPETSQTGSPFQEPLCGSSLACTQEEISSSGQSSNFDKSRLRNRPVKPSVRINSEIYDQLFESQIVASDHTYYNSKLEPCSKNKPRSKISSKDQSGKPVKSSASGRVEANPSEACQSPSGDRGPTKAQRPQPQTILANADTSTPTDSAADALSRIRREVGPPLPPLLAPLVATPPRTSRPVSPLISSSSPASPTSPVGQLSPPCDVAAPPVVSPLLEEPGPTSPSAAPAGERILSSPLQFCAATPKHAVPVPGRLPPCASSAHTAVAGPQENSVKILDTMYPELSARARTLSILKGNIQLTRGPPADRQTLPGPVSAITGFKAITSTSTAFVKTGGSSGGDCSQDKSRDVGTQQDSGGKRTLSACTLRSAKRLRLDSGSSDPETGSATAEGASTHPCKDLPQADGSATDEEPAPVLAASTVSQPPLNPKETVESHDRAIADALKKIAESSFDLLPVIRSHVYVGNISKKPVMRDEEKEVVYVFSTAKKHLAECLLHSILSELKLQKVSVEHSYVHALCRVYVGICRQLGDVERARLFCYSLLKEDFPESEKLTLFIANMWHDVFISQSVINKAMQLVARQRAKGEVLNCLRAFLNWEKNAPADVGFMVSKLLLTIQLCPKTEFQPSERFGDDLSDNTWEYIFAIDLLCCHQKWIWTHDNIISKELWPVMDKWIKYRKGHANIAYTPDIIIASILRLIGRLGQLGLKEGFPSAVRNISSVIGMFIQHARDEDIPWGVQLAAVYALCDLSPSNPEEISKILEAWRKETSRSVPAAVLSSLEEVSALCTQGPG